MEKCYSELSCDIGGSFCDFYFLTGGKKKQIQTKRLKGTGNENKFIRKGIGNGIGGVKIKS